MSNQNSLRHIKIDGCSRTVKYQSISGGFAQKPKTQDWILHGKKIKQQINAIRDKHDALKEVDLPDGIIRDDAIYVEFISAWNFRLPFENLHSDSRNSRYQLLSIKEERNNDELRYRVNVMLTEGGISHFLNKVEQYLTETVFDKKTKVHLPKNLNLLSNIESIQLATIKAFWNEPSYIPFPNENDVEWWEVWFRIKPELDSQKIKIFNQLKFIGAQVSELELLFPEHYIRLVKGSARQLSQSLLLLDTLSELRKPKETADFFVNLDVVEKEDAVSELKDRIDNKTNKQSMAICLLDTGVQNQHPLLKDFTLNRNMFSYKPEDWGTYDSDGHGTGMAGIALYGDLIDVMTKSSRVQIFHQLESVKVFNQNDSNSPELYGSITIDSASRPVIEFPDRQRVYCMAITNKCHEYSGRQSSWSAAIDKFIFGNEKSKLDKQLFFISTGNIRINKPEEFPQKNKDGGVHDPAQSFNAVSVGAFTDKDVPPDKSLPIVYSLARRGDMSPYNSTSLTWNDQWAYKPDIVMQGGNLGVENGSIIRLPSLELLSTHADFQTTLFQTFFGTSAASALASHLAVQLKIVYPEFWPETIRALLIHSATWTSSMLNNESLKNLIVKKDILKKLLRTFGYGVPDSRKAQYSAYSSLTLVIEDRITPFKKDKSVKFNEMHFFELPWPAEVLQEEIGNSDVTLNVTLSYFIEPNPGSRTYCSKFHYQSHGLRFNVIKADEDLETFQKRINKNSREVGEKNFKAEKWAIGIRNRNKGSIHRDFWIDSGINLSTRNIIAVYPVSGWYKTRTFLHKYNSTIRYSLIVSIESSKLDVDIYTPVTNKIRLTLTN